MRIAEKTEYIGNGRVTAVAARGWYLDWPPGNQLPIAVEYTLTSIDGTVTVNETGVKAGPFETINEAIRKLKGEVWDSLDRLTRAIKGEV